MIIATRMLTTLVFTASLFFVSAPNVFGICLLLHPFLFLRPVLHGTMALLIGPICESSQHGFQ
jgi:hypothetical protein